jgi:hypothetical protein
MNTTEPILERRVVLEHRCDGAASAHRGHRRQAVAMASGNERDDRELHRGVRIMLAARP